MVIKKYTLVPAWAWRQCGGNPHLIAAGTFLVQNSSREIQILNQHDICGALYLFKHTTCVKLKTRQTWTKSENLNIWVILSRSKHWISWSNCMRRNNWDMGQGGGTDRLVRRRKWKQQVADTKRTEATDQQGVESHRCGGGSNCCSGECCLVGQLWPSTSGSTIGRLAARGPVWPRSAAALWLLFPHLDFNLFYELSILRLFYYCIKTSMCLLISSSAVFSNLSVFNFWQLLSLGPV